MAKVSGTQSAQSTRTVKAPNKGAKFDFALVRVQHRYEEKSMSVEGALTGIQGNVLVPMDSTISIGARAEYLTGETNYEGQYLDIYGTGTTSRAAGPSKDYSYEIAGLGDLKIYRNRGSTASFYSGLAYRFHNNRVEIPGGYRREIGHIFVPVGLTGEIALSKDWKLVAVSELDILISGQTHSHLSDVGREYSDITNSQSRGVGIRAGLQVQRRLNNFEMYFGPYYRYWRVEDSNAVSASVNGEQKYFIEPQNTTTSLGINLGFIF